MHDISKDFVQYWSSYFSSFFAMCVCTRMYTRTTTKIELGQNKSISGRSSYHWVVWERTTHPEYPSQLRVEDSWQLGKQCYQTSLAPNHCFCQLLQQTLLGFHLLVGRKPHRNKQSTFTLFFTTCFCGNFIRVHNSVCSYFVKSIT